jgi:hypothetical protein
MHGFAYDAIHDEIVVTSPVAAAILTFRGGASGEEAPIRVIQGPRTLIAGVPDKVDVDPANSEIFFSSETHQAILVFDREATGDVAPKRVLSGPDTHVRVSGGPHGQVAIDPVRNLLLVNTGAEGILIFDRTASGNATPKAVIKGPRTGVGNITYGDLQVHSPTGLVVAGCFGGSVCAWSLNDQGDMAPRWKIPVQQITGYVPSGLALNPTHKEIIFAAVGQDAVNIRPPSGVMNTIITFSWPEIFGSSPGGAVGAVGE